MAFWAASSPALGTSGTTRGSAGGAIALSVAAEERRDALPLRCAEDDVLQLVEEGLGVGDSLQGHRHALDDDASAPASGTRSSHRRAHRRACYPAAGWRRALADEGEEVGPHRARHRLGDVRLGATVADPGQLRPCRDAAEGVVIDPPRGP